MFGVAILVLSLLAVSNPTAVFPKEVAATPSASVSPTPAVEYYLPYPGILPDNPLYKLKMVRDRIVLWLTFDPLKKSQLELLYADKRVNAAWELEQGGKSSLGVSTATKAEKYLEQSANGVIDLQKQGLDVKSQLLTLQSAATKHTELLQTMQERLTGSDQTTIMNTVAETQMVGQSVTQALRESK